MHIKNISHLQHCGGHCLSKIKHHLCLEQNEGLKKGVLNINDARKIKMPCNEVKKYQSNQFISRKELLTRFLTL